MSEEYCMETIGFIGCGNMGGAIVKRIAPIGSWRVLVHDAREEQARSIARESGASAVSLARLMEESDTIVLAVKPQILPELYGKLASGAVGKHWISIAAGVSIDTLSSNLHSEQVVRIMPNIAAAAGKAVTAVTPHPQADPRFVESVFAFARSFGTAHAVAEQQMSAFVGVSGSAIATCFAFLHGIAMGGVREGLPYDMALSLIADTVESATALTRETGKHPEELLTTVCSPAGTTIEAIKILADGAFTGILMESVTASSERAREMEALARKNI